jgi:hypothetical protein
MGQTRVAGAPLLIDAQRRFCRRLVEFSYRDLRPAAHRPLQLDLACHPGRHEPHSLNNLVFLLTSPPKNVTLL